MSGIALGYGADNLTEDAAHRSSSSTPCALIDPEQRWTLSFVLYLNNAFVKLFLTRRVG